MQIQGWKILLVEDDKDDCLIISDLLNNTRTGLHSVDWKQDYQQGLQAACSNQYDAILVGQNLGSQSGIDLIRAASSLNVSAPLILLTGSDKLDIDLDAFAAGAMDYLEKSLLTPALLEKSIRYAVEHKKMVIELAAERSRLSAIIQNAPVGIIFTDLDGNFTLSNPAIEELFPGGVTGTADGPVSGYSLHHSDGRPYQPEELPLPGALKGASSRDIEILVRGTDGGETNVAAYANPIYGPDGSLTGAVAVLLDQTRQKRIERAFRDASEQMEWMARLPEENPNPAIRISVDGQLLYSNAAARQIPGITFETGKPLPDIFAQLVKQAVDEARVFEADLLFENRYYDFLAVPLLSKGYINLYGRDITDRVQMERELYESKERFRLMGEAIPYGFWHTDIEGKAIYISPELQQLLGLDDAPITEISWYRQLGISELDASRMEKAWLESVKTRKMFEVEHAVVDREGKQHFILSRGMPIYSPDGVAISMVGINLDITERKRLEAEQVEYQAQIETQRRLIRQREMERLQVARSLHDGPFQSLYAANIALVNVITSEDRPDRREHLEWVHQIFLQEIEQMREFIQELRPPALVSYGLETAIRSHLARFSQLYPNIHVETDLMKDGQILTEETRLSIYRIYQEMMANAGKHAYASRLQVSLVIDETTLALTVKDDGKGFVVPEQWSELALSDHLGLIGIRERAEMIGAELTIQSEPGHGTTARVSIPLASTKTISSA